MDRDYGSRIHILLRSALRALPAESGEGEALAIRLAGSAAKLGDYLACRVAVRLFLLPRAAFTVDLVLAEREPPRSRASDTSMEGIHQSREAPGRQTNSRARARSGASAAGAAAGVTVE